MYKLQKIHLKPWHESDVEILRARAFSRKNSQISFTFPLSPFVSRVPPESAAPRLLLRSTLLRSCPVLGPLDPSSSEIRCFMPITEPSLPLTALLGFSFESSDLSVLALCKLFRKVLSSNTKMPGAASYLGDHFIFELLQFLPAVVTLWSAFCCDGRMGFWAYSRILKYERNFQVGYGVKSLAVLGCHVIQFQGTLFSSLPTWEWQPGVRYCTTCLIRCSQLEPMVRARLSPGVVLVMPFRDGGTRWRLGLV